MDYLKSLSIEIVFSGPFHSIKILKDTKYEILYLDINITILE